LSEVEFYEAASMTRLPSPATRITLINVSPFTIDATFDGQFAVTIKTSTFEMLENDECDYVYRTDDSAGLQFSLQVSSPVISMLIDAPATTKLTTLDTTLEFSYDRSIDVTSYASSPGYIGCANKSFVFLNENYNDIELSGFNQTFVVDGTNVRHISFSGMINVAEKTPVWLYQSATDDAPLALTGLQIDNTSSWDYELDTNYFSLFCDESSWRNGTFLIRYE
ncbi:hypothetical protein PFISCL1PPCAC_8730, partial [Pristionchus fissidentatus]